MPDQGETDSVVVVNKSQSQAGQSTASGSSRRTSSTISLHPRIQSPSPRGSIVPLTPEESPPVKSTRKRSANTVEVEDKAIDEASSPHSRSNSGEQPVHICLCQPDPKIPRPRNAFILYRQHYQGSVVAQHPGLANPEISKIIGEQWQGLDPEEKLKWKALAEDEKARHQQQYPTYRYRPRRNGRRNSISDNAPGSAGERPRCAKCGGRAILPISAPAAISTAHPPTPGTSTITPISKTLPALRDMSLQSPRGPPHGHQYQVAMSPPRQAYHDERDDVGPLSPGAKRRRYNEEHPAAVTRAMPPHYGASAAGVAVGPGTPFPFPQPGQPQHGFPPAATHVRRESLPALRGVVSPPGPMAPPPRPGMGYAAHRTSQGHIAPDRSLILPPIQVTHYSAPSTASDAPKTAEEHIKSADFRYKIKLLSQVAPPVSSVDNRRGPLIAVEGDDAEAVKALAEWLNESLTKETDLTPTLIEGPTANPSGSKEEMMSQYHHLVAEWLKKSVSILAAITVAPEASADAAMTDASSEASGPASSEKKANDTPANAITTDNIKTTTNSPNQEKMDISPKRTSVISSTSTPSSTRAQPKPLAIIPNFSLHASNRFACAIPIGKGDPYSPNDHWQWAATQWRGIIGPDLTIYVRDAVAYEAGRPTFEMEGAGRKSDGAALFVVRRGKEDEERMSDAEGVEARIQVEPAVLRRVGFEVSELVRAFGRRGGSGGRG